MDFRIQSSEIHPAELQAQLEDARCGAVVQFEGRIRNHNDGLEVEQLHYEAHEGFAIAEGKRVLSEARQRFAVERCCAVHRIGNLAIGDIAVWVGVSSAHRQEAFLACRWIMDEIKNRVAIWKKEQYREVEAKWVGIADTAKDTTPEQRYRRQSCLPGFGEAGQQRLANAKILVAGCGGLGCPALQTLTGLGIGTLTLCDGDRIALDNLPRQLLFGDADLGRNKAEAAADHLRRINPQLSFQPVAEMITADNVDKLLEGQDLVLDCADNFSITYLLNDHCMQRGIPLIQASVHQLEGQLNAFLPNHSGGCYRCLWPEPPAPGCVQNCQEAGILATTTVTIGTQQAMEALKVLLGWETEIHVDRTLLTDLLSGQTRRIRRQRRQDCPTCTGSRTTSPSLKLLSPENFSLAELPAELQKVDLREDTELQKAPAPGQHWLQVPRNEWEQLPEKLDAKLPVLCACASGKRALSVGEWLTSQGFEVLVWQGAISAFPQEA